MDIRYIPGWQIKAGDKTYTLDLGRRYRPDEIHTMIALPPWDDLYWQANQLVNKTVIVSGTLDGTTVHVTSLKGDDEYVKETTEIEARGQLSAIYLETLLTVPMRSERFPPVAVWNFVVDGKTYTLNFATAALEDLARKLDGKAVVLTGVLNKDTITVKTLKIAE